MTKKKNDISKEALKQSEWKKLLGSQITENERNKLESLLENDIFAKEAYEGFKQSDEGLQKSVEKSKAAAERTKKKLGLQKERKALTRNLRIVMGVAATLLLFAVSFIAINQLRENSSSNNLAKSEGNSTTPTPEEQEQQLPTPDRSENTNQETAGETSSISPLEEEQAPNPIDDVVLDEEQSTEPKQTKALDNSPTATGNVVTEEESREREDKAERIEIAPLEERDAAPAAQGIEDFESISTTPSANAPVAESSSFQQGVNAYNAASYNQAIKLFETALKNGNSVDKSTYYLGLCYKQKGKDKKAISYFDEVIGRAGNSTNNARWQRASIFIESGLFAAAKQDLQFLIDNNTKLADKARKKLAELP